MLGLILGLVMLAPTGQLASESFYVDKVIVLSTYDSRYIFRRENAILPPDRLVREADVICFSNELRASGLFHNVRVQPIKRTEDTRSLRLTVTYRRGIERLTIKQVTLVGLPEVDEVKFLAKLNEKGVKPGTLLLTFYYESLEQKINESLRDSLPPNLVNRYQGSAWIAVRPAGAMMVRLIVSPKYEGCGS